MNKEKEKRLHEIREKYTNRCQKTLRSFQEQFTLANNENKMKISLESQAFQKHASVDIKNTEKVFKANCKEVSGRRYYNKNIGEKIITSGNFEGKQNQEFSKKLDNKLSFKQTSSPIKQIYESPLKSTRKIQNVIIPSQNTIKPFTTTYSPSPLRIHPNINRGDASSSSKKYDEVFSKMQKVQKKIKSLLEEEKLKR